jgi:hypothetical protein
MADISVERKATGGQSSWLWVLLAVIAVGGLMAWLATRPDTTTQVVTDETGTPAAAGAGFGAGADPVELSALSADPDAYLDQEVVVRGTDVAAALGPRAYWADVPGANPFLVVLDQSVQNIDAPVSGQSYDLQGRVQPVTEQMVDDWVTAGTIVPGSRDEATFATHYLLANQAQPAAGGS